MIHNTTTDFHIVSFYRQLLYNQILKQTREDSHIEEWRKQRKIVRTGKNQNKSEEENKILRHVKSILST